MADKITPRSFTKFLVTSTTAHYIDKFIERTLTAHTRLEKDTLPVTILVGGASWLIAVALDDYTDAVVDKTFDFAEAKLTDKKDKTTTK